MDADYVLAYRNTKLAVVEAKAWEKSLTDTLISIFMKSPIACRLMRLSQLKM